MASAPARSEAKVPALDVRGLNVRIDGDAGAFLVVRDMAFKLEQGETLAIVGESGCGKSMTALSLLGLLPDAATLERGEVRLAGTDLTRLSRAALEDTRGNRIAMIFQEPLTALNPVMTIGAQIVEVVRRHRREIGTKAARARAIEMLRLVRLQQPELLVDRYPHQLSGGMRQRAMIALALACEPAVLVADEPTTALDVSIQAQILGLIRDLQQRLGTALVLITHDLGVVAEMADRVIVMYAGRRVEVAPVEALFDAPKHPYTRGLMNATPHLAAGKTGKVRLADIPGSVPPLWQLRDGCPFASRCAEVRDRCRLEVPPLETKAAGHLAACWEVPRAG